MHTNIGWLKDKASGNHKATWGLGSELKLTPRLTGIAEDIVSVVFMPINILAGIGSMSEFSMMTQGIDWPFA